MCFPTIAAEHFDWARRELGLDSRFRFQTFSLRSSHYNAEGSVRPEEFVFPWPENAFTLSFAVSIFTHLSGPATRNYLAEIARTLQPGGRLFATFYVLDEQSMQLVADSKTHPPFSVTTDDGMIGDAASPEAAVAFHAQWLADALLSAGLTFDAFYPGRWRHLPVIAHQDIVIAHRPG